MAVLGYNRSHPDQITTGPDGALWFTEFFSNMIGRITTDGVVSESVIPTPDAHPVDIVSGSDGTLWFTEFDGNRIGRISVQRHRGNLTIAGEKEDSVGVAIEL